MTLAEVVQLQRAEEQANSARVRWEFRTQERRVGVRMVRVQVMLPQPVADLLAKRGQTSQVARSIILHWAQKVAGMK